MTRGVHRELRWAALGLFAVVAFFLRRVLFAGEILYQRDVANVWWGQMEKFVRCVASGSWPLWDPWRGFGQPLLAEISAQLLYPMTWLNLLAPPWLYYTFFVVVHLVLSGVGLFLLARRFGVSPLGAFVGAVVWVASGPFASLVSLIHHLSGAAWIPWVLLAADRTRESRRLSDAALWGAAQGAQVLAGSADMCVMTLLLTGLYVLRDLRRQGSFRLALCALLAFGLAAGIAAAQWLPTLDLVQNSARSALPAQIRNIWSVHPVETLQIPFPVYLHNLPLRPEVRAAIYGYREPWLTSLYLGLPALALVFGSLVPRQRPPRGFFAAVLAASLIVALGSRGGLYDLLVALAPPLRSLRYPSKAMVLAALAWSLLAAIGFDVWRRPEEAKGRRWLWLGIAPVTLLFAAGAAATLLATVWADRWAGLVILGHPSVSHARILAPRTQQLALSLGLTALPFVLRWRGRAAWRGFPVVLATVVAADLMAFHRDLHFSAPKALYAHRPEVLQALSGVDDGRVYVYDYSYPVAALTGPKGPAYPRPQDSYGLRTMPPGWLQRPALSLAFHLYLQPPTHERWGVYGSYDFDPLGLFPAFRQDMVEFLRKAEPTSYHLRLLQLGAVRYVVALHPDAWWKDLTPVVIVPGLFEAPIRVLSVPDPLPRAYVVSGARVVPDGLAAYSALTDPTFDPRREVLLASGAARRAEAGFSGGARILRLEPDRVRVEADLGAPGYLVLVDGYDPGWRATVDGQAAEILRANVAFRAVPLPAGRHVVEQVYRPPSVRVGLLLSSASVLMVVALMARAYPNGARES